MGTGVNGVEAELRVSIMRGVSLKRYNEFYQIVRLWPSVPLSELPTMLTSIDTHAKKWLGLTTTEASYREFVADRMATGDHGKVFPFAGKL